MTADNFTYYLKNPSHLYQVSYQELKSLVVQYPYCQNLRYLLMSKSQLENVGEYSKDLQLAATYSVDRTYLYELIHQEEQVDNSENFILNEDYLELKNISTPVEENTPPPSESIVLEQKTDYSLDIPQENVETKIAEIEEDASNKTYVPSERRTIKVRRVNLIEFVDAESPSSSVPPSATDEDASNEQESISDELETSDMEKTKETRSVIDQLLGNFSPIPNTELEEVTPLLEKENGSTVDESAVPDSANDDEFWGLLPVKESPILGREVLFEITNKTDKEMNELFQKKKSPSNQNTTPMDSFTDQEINTKKDDTSSPTPKTSFQSYLDQFQTPSGIIEEIKEEPELANAITEAVEEEAKNKENTKKKKTKKKNKKVKQKELAKVKKAKKKNKKKKTIEAAKKSIEENEDILSETLAELLAKQGSRKKAIQMYKRLSLIFPKKSGFFAKKIAKLKK